MRDMKIMWDREAKRWVAQFHQPIPETAKPYIRDQMVHIQQQRRLGLAPGPVRDDLDESIKALHELRIEIALEPRVKLAGKVDQYEPFTATAATRASILAGGI